VSTRLARWNHTGHLKGFGYVQFEHGFSAEAAVKAFRAGARADGGGEPVMVGDRAVQLDYETGAPRGSFKTASGRLFTKTPEATAAGKASAKASRDAAAAEPLPGEGTGRQRGKKRT
jgi:nucleolin